VVFWALTATDQDEPARPLKTAVLSTGGVVTDVVPGAVVTVVVGSTPVLENPSFLTVGAEVAVTEGIEEGARVATLVLAGCTTAPLISWL